MKGLLLPFSWYSRCRSICLHVQSKLLARRANLILFQMLESFGQITSHQWRRGGQSSRSIFRLGTIGNSCH